MIPLLAIGALFVILDLESSLVAKLKEILK
jgi:hypothetical protein